jgi:hypothetical protein
MDIEPMRSVPVRLRAGHRSRTVPNDRLGGDIASRARPILDDELLAKPLR